VPVHRGVQRRDRLMDSDLAIRNADIEHCSALTATWGDAVPAEASEVSRVGRATLPPGSDPQQSTQPPTIQVPLEISVQSVDHTLHSNRVGARYIVFAVIDEENLARLNP